MATEMLPENWPPLQEEAQRLAKDIMTACALIPSWFIAGPGDWDVDRDTGNLIDAMKLRLRDLSRPATRDHWVRWGLKKMPEWRKELRRNRDKPARLRSKLLKIVQEFPPDAFMELASDQFQESDLIVISQEVHFEDESVVVHEAEVPFEKLMPVLRGLDGED